MMGPTGCTGPGTCNSIQIPDPLSKNDIELHMPKLIPPNLNPKPGPSYPLLGPIDLLISPSRGTKRVLEP